MSRQVISTDDAPAAIGTYSQAIRAGDLLFVSGQIPLVPGTMEIVSESIDEQIEQVFANLAAICRAAGSDLAHVTKFTVFLTDLAFFASVNAAMERLLDAPYPARAVVEVGALPKGVHIEIDAIVALGD
jgi:reactive intermediate/imine deaminase